MNQEMFAELFGGKTRYRALQCLFENGDRDFGIRELAEMAGMNPGNLTRLIKRWEAVGLVDTTNDRIVRYRASPDPSLKALMSLFRQSGELVQRLKDYFAEQPDVESALIFGSYAREATSADSDVDILVVGDASELKVNAQLKPLGREFGRPMNVSVFELDDFMARLRSGDSFVTRICEEPSIQLKGESLCR